MSEAGTHTEIFFANKVNFWRDLLPERVRQSLMGKHTQDRVDLSLLAGELVPCYSQKELLTLGRTYFTQGNRCIEPRFGRFYPKGLLKDTYSSDNMDPFRCLHVEPSQLTMDFNHPLARKNIELTIDVHYVWEKKRELGGECRDWMQIIADGPGMQGRWDGKPTDFFSENPFYRSDEREDHIFYDKPRLVTHIDERAIENIKYLYGTLLKPGMKVLDLMSSWRSHVPELLKLKSLTGLGLNREEMENNPQLREHIIHDLNEHPQLPFNDEEFDAVICTVSVEYMIHPFDVFLDVARILKPKGYFIHTFSNRWFQPKVVNIWKNIHEFERVGLVLEYLLQSGAYENLKTYSLRGMLRRKTDHYYPRIKISDPVYAVWGQTKTRSLS